MSVPRASQMVSPVTTVRLTAARARNRPTRAPRSSSSTTGSSGIFECRTNDHQLASPFSGSDSWMAVRNENDSRTMAMPRTAKAQIGSSTSWGWRIFSIPS